MGEIPDSHKVSFWDQTRSADSPRLRVSLRPGAPHTPLDGTAELRTPHGPGPAVEGQAQSLPLGGERFSPWRYHPGYRRDPLWNKEIADNVHPADAAADTTLSLAQMRAQEQMLRQRQAEVARLVPAVVISGHLPKRKARSVPVVPRKPQTP